MAFACAFVGVAQADWLSDQARNDGSVSAVDDRATAFQATAEAARTFRSLERFPEAASAESFVLLEEFDGTEYLSRRILAAAAGGQPTGALVASLSSRQNADGGFGEFAGYESTPLDTSFALYALHRAGQQLTPQNLAALNYLVRTQSPNGGWAVGANDSSVYVTAQALQALWQFRQSLPSAIQSGTIARQFILGRRLPGGLWESDLDSAVALLALAPMQLSNGELASSVSALNGRRLANGSWGNDVFTTALAMRATLLASSANANPDLARIRGRLVDGNSLASVVGATVTISGAASLQRTSDAEGWFEFADLAAGSYSLTIQAPGYPVVSSPLALQRGQTLDLGTLRLLSSASPTVSRIEGVVTDTHGAPIPAATVEATGVASVQTDVQGRYLINNVPPGNVTIKASKNGFHAAQGATVLIAGATVNFSPSLRPVLASGFSITGTFTDVATQQPLAGVTVQVSGSAQTSATSDSSGAVALTGLTPGTIRVVTSLEGYASKTAIASVDGGQTLDISAALEAIPPNAPETFSINGRVTASSTGDAISGAQVLVSGGVSAATETDSAGNYALAGLTPGSFSIAVSASGYQTATASATGVAQLHVDFSPALLPTNASPTGLRARVFDTTSGNAIEGASVVISTPSGNVSTTTAPNGEFLVRNLEATPTVVTISASGYQQNQLALTPTAGYINDLGELGLLPVSYAAPVTLTGRVVNSATDAPLASVTVVGFTTEGTQTTQSAADGSFSVTVPAGEVAELEFAAPNFVTAQFTVLATPQSAEFGQVRLRPEGLDSLLADLAVLSVDASLTTNHPETYQLAGSVSVRIQNRGYADAPASTSLVAFEDRNGNRVRDEDEAELGRTTLSSEFTAGESREVFVTVAGATSFRDAPITILADADQQVVERDETNNAQVSVGNCVALPPAASALAPVLKWHWRGSPGRPNDVEVFGPPMVGQFTDDNGDGAIDERDVPDVVFATRQQTLTAVSGDDGRTLWQTAPNLVTGLGSLALGDIDGDGLNEIVVSNGPRTLLRAFEHDGTLKWSVPNGPTHADTTRDGITLADLNGDGVPEILTGRRVYSNEGVLLWQGTNDHGGLVSYGTLPIAADINRDGTMEVIAGRSVYTAAGALLWHQSGAVSDGFNAIGNFDDDDFPEIVLIAQARLYLLEHTGAIKWGPVTLSGGGSRGGAPTVGDFDGDGQPEIGIAGATFYSVFETDGSLKWRRAIQDSSSAFTGSSLFDFDGDGRIEVVYADEQNLFIFDGATGNELNRIPNRSGTTLEYPVIADVDGDGRAELIIASNEGNPSGVRVFEGGQGEWMPTRPIWNQSTYHISNVEDDGSIPVREAESWLEHNSYRANAAVPRQAEPVADLTAGALRLIDNGIGQAASLTVRVGNAGAPLDAGITTVAFYDGAPGSGTLLGTVAIPALASGAFADVRLDGIGAVSPSGTLNAVVDPTARVTECDELNNLASTPSRPAVGTVSVSTNQAAYAPGATVQIDSTVTNTGNFANSYRVELSVSDAAGNQIAALPQFTANSLASGSSVPFSTMFDSADLLAGDYVVHAALFDVAGTLLMTTQRGFAIAHDASQGPAASLRVSTDRSRYHTSDVVSLETLSRNLTSATVIEAARVHLVVSSAQGGILSDEYLDVGLLMPATGRLVRLDLTLVDAAEGVYTVAGTLEDSAGQLLASGSASFEVRSDTLLALRGSVLVGTPTIEAGQTQLCTSTVSNRGTIALSGLEVRHLVVRIADDVVVSEELETTTIAGGGSHSSVASVNTTGYAAGDHACTVQARVGGEWRDLAYGTFKVTVSAPAVAIEGNLTVGTRGRLLVLMDESNPYPCVKVRDVELWAPFHHRLPANARIHVELFDANGNRVDVESVQLAQFKGTVNARRGSGVDMSITGASRDVLTVQVASNSFLGQGYRMVATATADSIAPIVVESNVMGQSCGWNAGHGAHFGDFRCSGGRKHPNGSLPASLSSDPTLAAQRAFLDKLLKDNGWSFKIVTDDEAFERELHSGAYAQYAIFSEHEKLDELTQKELREAVFRGEGLLEAGQHDRRHHGFDEALGIKPVGREPHATDVTFEAGWLPVATVPITRTSDPVRIRLEGATPIATFERSHGRDSIAATQYAYGRGKSVYVGYDLLAEATRLGENSAHAILLREALLQVSPAVQPHAGEVIPLRLEVRNRGVATPAYAELQIPAGVTVVDAGGAEVSGNKLSWTFSLAAEEVETMTFWVRLPAAAGSVAFEAIVKSGVAPNYLEQDRAPLTVIAQARATLADARALAATINRCDKVRTSLSKAQFWLDRGENYFALASLLQATDEVMSLSHAQADTLRWMIDDSIWTLARAVQ